MIREDWSPEQITGHLEPYQGGVLTLTYNNVQYAELLAGLASDHYRIEVSRHVHSMAQFGFLVNDSLSHNKHRVRFCGSHRP